MSARSISVLRVGQRPPVWPSAFASARGRRGPGPRASRRLRRARLRCHPLWPRGCCRDWTWRALRRRRRAAAPFRSPPRPRPPPGPGPLAKKAGREQRPPSATTARKLRQETGGGEADEGRGTTLRRAETRSVLTGQPMSPPPNETLRAQTLGVIHLLSSATFAQLLSQSLFQVALLPLLPVAPRLRLAPLGRATSR